MALISAVDDLDLSALRLFTAVVELGSVSKAAARMHISQPSATAKLRKLERHLGVQLVERSPTGSLPTDAGGRLASRCAEVLSAAAALLDRADAIRSAGDRLAIATTRHIGEHFLAEWIAAATLRRAGTPGSETPGTDPSPRRLDDAPLHIVELDTLGVARAVRDGEAAVGFVEGPHPPLGLRSSVVTTEPVIAAVGRRHPWYGRRTAITPATLVGADLLLPRPGSGLRDLVESILAPYQLGASGGDHVDVPSTCAARLSAIGGDGVAFLPQCWARNHLASGDLYALPVRELSIELAVRAVWRGDRPTHPAARALLESLSP